MCFSVYNTMTQLSYWTIRNVAYGMYLAIDNFLHNKAGCQKPVSVTVCYKVPYYR